MATTGILNGTDLVVQVGGTAITHATSASINFNMETREATTKDSAGYTEVLSGLRSVTIDVEAMTALDATYGFEDLYSVWENRTELTLKFGTTETGDQTYQVNGYMTSLAVSSGVEDSSTFSASFQCTGTVTEANNP
jgi:predicted secreted protein